MKAWIASLVINSFLNVCAGAQVPTSSLHTVNSVPGRPVYSYLVWDTISGAKKMTEIFSRTTLTPVSSLYYENMLGFFCKKELQLEKAIRFPVKFRLGSVAYTDKMEGKIH